MPVQNVITKQYQSTGKKRASQQMAWGQRNQGPYGTTSKEEWDK